MEDIKKYSYAIVSAVSYSLFPILSKSLSADLSPLLLSTLLFTTAAAVVTRGRPVKPNILLTSIAITGAVIGPILFFFGVSHTTAANAAVLSNSELVFTAVVALSIFKEKLNLPAVLIISTGVFLTSISINPNFSTSGLIGDFLVLGSGLFFALDNNLTQIATRRQYTATQVLQIKFILGAAITAALLFAIGGPIKIKYTEVPMVLLLGSVAYALPLFMLFKSIHAIGAVNSLLITTSGFNIFALFFAYFFLHEHIPVFYAALGVGVICTGAYVLVRRPFSIHRHAGDSL